MISLDRVVEALDEVVDVDGFSLLGKGADFATEEGLVLEAIELLEEDVETQAKASYLYLLPRNLYHLYKPLCVCSIMSNSVRPHGL